MKCTHVYRVVLLQTEHKLFRSLKWEETEKKGLGFDKCIAFRSTQRENFGKILEMSFSAFLDCFRAFERNICVS